MYLTSLLSLQIIVQEVSHRENWSIIASTMKDHVQPRIEEVLDVCFSNFQYHQLHQRVPVFRKEILRMSRGE